MKFLNVLIFITILTGLMGCSSKYGNMVRDKKEKKLMRHTALNENGTRYKENVILEPPSLTLTKKNVTFYIEHFNNKELDEFFSNKERFRKCAGSSPYFDDMLVFYIRITNNSGGKIKINSENFVILDDLNSQYSHLNINYIISLYKSKSKIYSLTKSAEKLTPGGIYGTSVDMATSLAGRGIEKKFIQLKNVELSGGYIYSGVVYDGLIAFFKPSQKASIIKLILPDIITKFDANNEALEKIEFKVIFGIKASS